MLRFLLSLLALASAPLLQSAEPAPTPVLLELFTSLGCSSCPPADQLLAEIDAKQPVPGARLIVLSEHVDYWDNPQWSDPFSSANVTNRQQAYDHDLGVEEYTPQLVVDGRSAVLGSSWPKAEAAVQSALHTARIPVHITAARDGDKAKFDISAGPNTEGKKAAVFLVLARDRTSTHVGGGENAGHDLSEVAVAYSVKQIDKIDAQSSFKKSLSVALPAQTKAGDLRAIVFLRKADSLEIIGSDEATF